MHPHGQYLQQRCAQHGNVPFCLRPVPFGYTSQRLHYKVETHADGSQTVYERFRLSTLSPDGAVLASIEEDWCLRRLDKEELLQLAHAAGLAEVDASRVPTAALETQEEGKFVFLQAQAAGS